MDVVGVWTGWHANLLRAASRLTVEAFAEQLGTAVRTVAKWSSEPDVVPMPELQRALDTLLSQADDGTKARFAWLMARNEDGSQASDADTSAAELRLANDPVISQALGWLDEHSGWRPGSARRTVAGLLTRMNLPTIRDSASARSRVGREDIAVALGDFYSSKPHGYSGYTAVLGDDRIRTSILTRVEWLDLRIALGSGLDRIMLDTAPAPAALKLDRHAASAAAQRLALALASGTKIVNSPLYQLKSIDIGGGQIAGTVGLTEFVAYALTSDLLENEIIDCLANKRAASKSYVPLRSRYLPTAEAVLDLTARVCVGGPLALFAAARPRGRHGHPPDYVLLVQERAGRVLNAAQRLAVIPKAFHQPLADFSDDAQISATLEREMEEELFGRTDVDTTLGGQLHADPMHISLLSGPMRWLVEHPEQTHWRMECTGFGLNLVSGNFEFATLIVIEDESWWSQYGGHIEANWESAGLRRYSSLDAAAVRALVHDASWSNEGIFAFLQGLRRLRETGGDRVDLPQIEWEL